MKDIYHSDNISVVVDNNVLVDLSEIGCLNLLFNIFDCVIIPQVIYDDELPDEIKSEINQHKFQIGLIETEVGLETYALLVNEVEFKKLSRYDRFAIAIAKENFYYCNSNDKPVRAACKKLNIKYTGVLGVLGRSYVKGVITVKQLETYIELLISDETSCYIDFKVIEKFKLEIMTQKVIEN
jgi:predicted nucleic acid-binding protein